MALPMARDLSRFGIRVNTVPPDHHPAVADNMISSCEGPQPLNLISYAVTLFC